MAILTILKTALSNNNIRNILFGVILMVLLIFGWSMIKSHYYNSGYSAGEANQLSIQEKEQIKLKEKYLQDLKIKDEERNNLNLEISTLKKDYSDLKQKRSEKESKLEDKIDAYEKSNANNVLCLDPQWMQLYKGSLPE